MNDMLRPPNLHDTIVDNLGRMIADGGIGFGDALPREDDLALKYGVSRTVVREVTKTLQALGLVVTGPRIGSRVQPLNRWRLLDPRVMGWIVDANLAGCLKRDLLELRAMIEPAAAALAAERASPSEIASIRACVASMADAANTPAHQKADFQFHEYVLEASGNILLIQLRPILQAVLKASFRLSMENDDRVRASVAIHNEVAESIAARRPEAARKAMLTLIRVAENDIAHSAAATETDEMSNKTKIRETHDDGRHRKVRLTIP